MRPMDQRAAELRGHNEKENWMKALIARCRNFLRSEEAPTATEYAVMLALVIVVVIGAVQFLGGKVSSTMTSAASALK